MFPIVICQKYLSSSWICFDIFIERQPLLSDFPNVSDAIGFIFPRPGAIRRAYFGDCPGRAAVSIELYRVWRYIDRYSLRGTMLSIRHARRSGQGTIEFSSWVLGQTRVHLENFQTLRIPTNASRIVIQKYFPGVVTRRHYRSNPRGI